jgi:hypothetical protein
VRGFGCGLEDAEKQGDNEYAKSELCYCFGRPRPAGVRPSSNGHGQRCYAGLADNSNSGRVTLMMRVHSRRPHLGLAAGLVALAVLAPPTTARADRVITVDNQTSRAVKAIGPGGGAMVGPGIAPVRIAFDSTEPVGVTLQLWWVAEPRQFCRIFAPWDRTVVVTGDQVINCRSHN